MMKFRIEYYNHNEVPEIHLNKRNTQMISHLNKIGLSTQIFTKDDLKEALKKKVKEFPGNEEVMRDLKKAYIFLKERTTHILPNRG